MQLHCLIAERIIGRKIKVSERVDHKNRDKLDCRRSNLRVVPDAWNTHNLGVAKNNTSGYRGVWWSASHKKWVAAVRLNRQRHNLGYFDTALEAHETASKWRLANMPGAVD